MPTFARCYQALMLFALMAVLPAAINAQNTKVNAARLVKPGANSTFLQTDAGGAVLFGTLEDLATPGAGIDITGNTITNDGDTDESDDVLLGGNTVSSSMVVGTNSAHSLLFDVNGVPFVSLTTAYTMTVTSDVASTNTAYTQLQLVRNSTGTPAVGLGSSIDFAAESSTTLAQPMGAIQMAWTTVTNASRTAAMSFKTVNNAGSPTTRMTISGPGEVGIAATPISGLELSVTGEAGVGSALNNTTRAGRAFNVIDANAVARVWRYTATTTAGPAVELVWGNTGDDVNNSSNRFWDFYLSGQSNAFGIRQRTGGVNNTAIFINSTRKVGIGNGETQPLAHLEVTSDGTAITDTIARFKPSTGSDVLAVYSNGRVGINGGAPSEALDVLSGNVKADAVVLRTYPGTVTNTTAGLFQYVSSTGIFSFADGTRRYPVVGQQITLECVDYNTNWATGRTKAFFAVPAYMNNWKVSRVFLACSSIGTGTNTVAIEKGGSSQCTQNITSGTHTVTCGFTVSTDDIITLNITAVGATPTKGLHAVLEFTY